MAKPDRISLRDLEAQFVQREIKVELVRRVRRDVFAARPAGPWTDDDFENRMDEVEYRVHVDTLAEAHGIRFLCPICVETSGHGVVCWFEGKVPDGVTPGPGRWTPKGTGIDDLSFVPGRQSHSVQLLGGCRWHGHVIDGHATLGP